MARYLTKFVNSPLNKYVTTAKFRQFSSATPNALVTTDDNGLATIKMNRAPANSLSLEFNLELLEHLSHLEQSGAKALVLTTELPNIFCAGLELSELHQPSQERVRSFWTSFQDLWIKLYSYKLPTIAAITGHSPAAGCVLSLCCDYRIMQTPKYSIGLNETQLGLVAPFWVMNTMIDTIGMREAEKALSLGTLFTAQQAKSVGLVDEVADSREEVMDRANKVATQYMKVPGSAWHKSKMMVRSETLEKMTSRKEQDIIRKYEELQDPEVQQVLGMYVKALKAKSKK